MKTVRRGFKCLCGRESFSKVFTYNGPSSSEIRFQFSKVFEYFREVHRCNSCGHFVSVHNMDATALYAEDYVSSNYRNGDGLRKAFDRIISLDPARSDNEGRVRRIIEFAEKRFGPPSTSKVHSVLDVGSGLCVFLHRMKALGWDCTALDTDPRSITHAKEIVGAKAVCSNFMLAHDLGCFDLVTFNKVLEHVPDPVAMLKKAAPCLKPEGLVYLEVPDGEAAVHEGADREEFTIDHFHVFSVASLALLCRRAGFNVLTIERLRDPSGKFTLRSFIQLEN